MLPVPVVFFRNKPEPRPTSALERVVAERLPKTDEATRRVVTAIAGLLACVAFSDHVMSPEEERSIRVELGRIHGLDAFAVNAITDVVKAEARRLSAEGDQLFARDIRELCEREQRVEVLDAVLEIAAADGRLTLDETNYLRRLATKLGLSQEEYVLVQERHRDKLTVLSG